MALKLSLLLVLIVTSSFTSIIHNNVFYNAFKSDSLTIIEEALNTLKREKPSSTNDAYIGGLKMRKASYVQGAAKKLNIFKEGRQLLEQAIQKYPQNVEYRFIRLTIQEHAPKVLRYNKSIEEDRSIVVKGYKKLNRAIQVYVMNYARSSELLKENELQ